MAAYTVVSADSQVSETFTRFPHNTSELGTCPRFPGRARTRLEVVG